MRADDPALVTAPATAIIFHWLSGRCFAFPPGAYIFMMTGLRFTPVEFLFR